MKTTVVNIQLYSPVLESICRISISRVITCVNVFCLCDKNVKLKLWKIKHQRPKWADVAHQILKENFLCVCMCLFVWFFFFISFVGFVTLPSFEAVYCFICGHRRVAVARYRMICLVLVYSHLFPLRFGAGSTVPREGFNLKLDLCDKNNLQIN